LALTVPEESVTRTVPLADEALISPPTPRTLTSPLAVESASRPVKPSALRLPLAVVILFRLRLAERGTLTSKRTLASQLQLFGYFARSETFPGVLVSSTSTCSRSRPCL
jgi:hypothetical protein